MILHISQLTLKSKCKIQPFWTLPYGFVTLPETLPFYNPKTIMHSPIWDFWMKNTIQTYNATFICCFFMRKYKNYSENEEQNSSLSTWYILHLSIWRHQSKGKVIIKNMAQYFYLTSKMCCSASQWEPWPRWRGVPHLKSGLQCIFHFSKWPPLCHISKKLYRVSLPLYSGWDKSQCCYLGSRVSKSNSSP